MAKKAKKINLDLNGDGVVDKKDKSIAGKVLSAKMGKVKKSEKKVEVKKEVVEEEVKLNGRIAEKDISRKYRKGDLVPQEQIDQWEKVGINIDLFF